jgi:S-adenosylmethionine synthetase
MVTHAGALSGKGPSKADRAGCSTARWIAKSIVAVGLADRSLIQVSHETGNAEPLSVYVNKYGTGKLSNAKILHIKRTST